MATVTLTIDGKTATVDAGTTVLDAARKLGIDIPTLCHVEGLEPSTSCYLCSVQVQGKRTLSPACGLPSEEGMVIITDSEDIRATRRMALELLFSDHAGDCAAPCAVQCPAGLDIPGFLYHLANEDTRGAMQTINQRLSLPGALGRICPRLCEQSCRRCTHDEGLAIAALHRYAPDREDRGGSRYVPPTAASTGRSVAIIGAGPAGLTAAFYLLQYGHDCTLYDAHPAPGGMLRYGIPEYRLPKAALDAEIEVIRQLGAAFQMNRRWGEDFTLADLRRDHDAVFIAIGAQRAQGLRCEGESLSLSGIEFLDRVAKGERPAIGDDVVVIGGGNTAMDAARTALRLQRMNGAGSDARVRVLYRRTRREMPCLLEEADAAEHEGVSIDFLVAPLRLERVGENRLRLTCERMELGEPDASGRRRPVPIDDSDFTIDAMTVIAAIGQSVDTSLAQRDGLELSKWGIAADQQTMATNLAGVFAGGDAVLGADLAVRAIAAGRAAAVSIDQYLTGRPVLGPVEMTGIQMSPMDEDEIAEIFREIERTPRIATPELNMDKRLSGFDEVISGLNAVGALQESQRCMSCGCRKASGCGLRKLATDYGADPYRYAGDRRRFDQDLSHADIVYEPGKCIMCGACVQIAEQEEEPWGVAIVGRGFDVAMATPFGRPLSDGLQKSAARCADACPTGALARRTVRACDVAGCASCGMTCPPELQRF
jgi:formate dehydrogenase major subunit